MIFISHRGNLLKNYNSLENNPNQIEYCISQGYDVEIDIWFKNNSLWLGHDYPAYLIKSNWLMSISDRLWIHCKNIAALTWCSSIDADLNYFWHNVDDYTLTSKKNIWAYPGSKLNEKTICVLPETVNNYTNTNLIQCYGICSDNIKFYKETL